MSETDAEKFRLLQAEAIVEIFRRAYGRAPNEGEDWYSMIEDKLPDGPIDPASILTKGQIDDFASKHAPVIAVKWPPRK